MIYLDNHATTPLDPRVREAMLPYLGEKFGNPASTSHALGRASAAAVARAREQVAARLGAEPDEIVFMSGATEANNLALRGTAPEAGHMITTTIEHPAVLETAAYLESLGHAVTYLPVDETGMLDAGTVKDALRPDTWLISVMAANNEVGTIQPTAAVSAIAREAGVLFHTDASQAIGKIPLEGPFDLLSLTGHKIHGPVGCGALYVRRGTALRKILFGGPQEGDRRAGTLNTPGIVGLGMACELAEPGGPELRDRLQAALEAAIPGLVINGHPTRRLPGNLHVSLPGVRSDAMLAAMPGLAVSAGAACHTGRVQASPVLQALGFDEARAGGAIRFGIGRFTTETEIDEAVRIVTEAWKSVKSPGETPS
ncbi:MAG: cysteine desulfurase family protein [Planctomycetota bacterium]